MNLSLTPHLIAVDPYRIKFNSANPRKHRGSEFFRLKNSIEKVGMVQFPTVRDLPGGFHECIDGEGRVLVAQQNRQKTILVVSLGMLHDSEALTMLQAANAVRSFGFLEQCRGLANLHRRGDSTATLADRFKANKSLIADMVAIGYFPEDLHILILEDTARSEECANRWTYTLLREVLPLRQELPGKDPVHAREQGLTLDEMYDYTEVRLAIEQVLRGIIPDSAQMNKYVAQRRLELYEARFNKDLQMRLTAELEQAKQALKEDYSQQAQNAQQETVQRYENQIKRLEQERKALDKRLQETIKDAAKRPDILAEREKELDQKVEQAEAERLRLEALQDQVQEEARLSKLQLEEDTKRQLEEARREQRAAMDQKLAKERAEWEIYYAQRDQERQLQVETTIHQIVAHTTKQLADSQLSLLHLLSPGILPSVVRLQDPEMMGLLAQVQAVQETLVKAEETLLRSNIIPSSETERKFYDGYRSHV